VDLVFGSFGKYVHGPDYVPAALSECFDEASPYVGVGIERKLTGHLTRAG
jgi:hypothetical protein